MDVAHGNGFTTENEMDRCRAMISGVKLKEEHMCYNECLKVIVSTSAPGLRI